jgi:parallel beta-helix repeat protein
MRPIHRFAAIASLGLLASACGSDSNTTKIDPSMSQTAISSAFSGAAADSTIEMAAGTYHFTNSLNLANKNNITLKGAGAAQTILDFSGQTAGADGVVQSVPAGSTVKVTFQDFAVQDTAGDGIKVTGGSGVHFNRVNVSWPTRTVHGGYGIYPVQSKSVLIENSTVDGASDTGIYVGQSDGIVVRNNTLTNNVGGIEIENSFNADVTGNNCHDNTAGFLVFDLPSLPQVGGHNVRVYGNQFVNNNHPNFGDPSGTVAIVPAGTGGLVMANTKLEVFNNTFSGNTADGFLIGSCFAALPQATCLGGAAGYTPFPNQIYVHDNTFTNNGTNPLAANTDQNHPSFQLASLLAAVFAPAQNEPGWPDNHVSDVVYDGILSPLAGTGNPYQICAKYNGSGHFGNVHLDQIAGGGVPNEVATFDEAVYDCTLPALPAVPVPAL